MHCHVFLYNKYNGKCDRTKVKGILLFDFVGFSLSLSLFPFIFSLSLLLSLPPFTHICHSSSISFFHTLSFSFNLSSLRFNIPLLLFFYLTFAPSPSMFLLHRLPVRLLILHRQIKALFSLPFRHLILKSSTDCFQDQLYLSKRTQKISQSLSLYQTLRITTIATRLLINLLSAVF